LVFRLDLEEQQLSGFRYPYSTYPVEYSRHLQFQVGQQREEVFQALIDRSRSLLNLQRVKTIFGAKNRPPHRRRHRNPTHWGVVVETPTYDLTVFKVHYGKLTLKIYTKGEHVLRIEGMVHNTKELHGGRPVEYFPKIVTQRKEILVSDRRSLGGNVSGGRNRPLTGLSEWNWIRQAKAVLTLVLFARW
jgi:hypothetical protein